VDVTGIEDISMPDLTDEFAKTKLGVASAEEFRTQVRESMIQQEQSVERRRREQALFDAIREATKVTLAPELIEEEERQLAHDLMHQLEEQKMTLDQYLERAKMTREDFAKDLRSRGQKRLQLRFGIRKLIELKNIEMSDEEMTKAVEQLLASAPAEERAKIEPLYQKGQENYEQFRWQKKVEKLVDTLLA
jgi:FKBP-type peptidyl-prolyl cis-trans isomerase (trigger factor)